MSWARPLALAALLGGVLAFSFVANSYHLFVLTTVALTAMVGAGLNVLLGLTGQVSLGHVGFYAIGAYATAILTTTYGMSFWPALAAAAVLAGAIGVVLALPALRVSGPYLAMVTIAFGFIVEHGATEWRGLTGGANGILNIPPPTLFGYELGERDVAQLAVGFAVLLFALFRCLERSPWGLAMRAVRDSEVAAGAIGLNSVAVRTAAFALSAIAAGLAGAQFSPLTSFVSPSSFSFFQSVLFVLVVIVGGVGRVLGPLAGAAVVVLLPEFLAKSAEYRLLFFGILLLAVLWLAPEGIVGALAHRFGRPRQTAASGGGVDVPAWLAERATGAALAVEGLGISFGGLRALDELAFAARGGQVTSLIGPNGAGKTTVLNLVCGFYRPDQGSVRLGDRPISRLPSHLVARAGVARTYQTSQLFARMSVIDNLLIALRRGRLGSLAAALVLPPRDAELRRVAESLLAFVGSGGPRGGPPRGLAHWGKRQVDIAPAR
ncbi:MAG: ABC transporter permease subunit, partial [Pseudomonadota bacterium]